MTDVKKIMAELVERLPNVPQDEWFIYSECEVGLPATVFVKDSQSAYGAIHPVWDCTGLNDYLLAVHPDRIRAIIDHVKAMEAERDDLQTSADVCKRSRESWKTNSQWWWQRAIELERERNELRAENERLAEALVAHNDMLRSTFVASQRDAIHEVSGTTNYRLLADRISEVLAKYHALSNAARDTVSMKQETGPTEPTTKDDPQ